MLMMVVRYFINSPVGATWCGCAKGRTVRQKGGGWEILCLHVYSRLVSLVFFCCGRQKLGTSCGYEVTGIILLQAYLFHYSLLRGVTFEVLPLSSYALSPTMLPQLETCLELLMWNRFQCHDTLFLDGFSNLKFSSL
jgi:hypothetical protein